MGFLEHGSYLAIFIVLVLTGWAFRSPRKFPLSPPA